MRWVIIILRTLGGNVEVTRLDKRVTRKLRLRAFGVLKKLIHPLVAGRIFV